MSASKLLRPLSYAAILGGLCTLIGTYRFTDFFRVGAPLQLVLWVVVIVLAPIVWPM